MSHSIDSELDTLVARTAGRQPGRRIFHAVNGLLFWGLLHLTSIPADVLALSLGALFAVLLAVDLLRLRSESLNKLFFALFRLFASPREGSGIASSTWFTAGAGLAIAILPRPYAAGGILVLALADPIANWFGRLYGRQRFGSGTLFGSTLFWVVSFGILLPLGGVIPALTAASTTTLLEAARWKVDDNLVIPISAGGVLWLIAGVLG